MEGGNFLCFWGPEWLILLPNLLFLPILTCPAFVGDSKTHLQVAEGFLSYWLGTWVAVFLVLKLAPLTWWVKMSDLGLDTYADEKVCPVLTDKYREKLFSESTCWPLHICGTFDPLFWRDSQLDVLIRECNQTTPGACLIYAELQALLLHLGHFVRLTQAFASSPGPSLASFT